MMTIPISIITGAGLYIGLALFSAFMAYVLFETARAAEDMIRFRPRTLRVADQARQAQARRPAAAQAVDVGPEGLCSDDNPEGWTIVPPSLKTEYISERRARAKERVALEIIQPHEK
jgi:hypothetical protein